MAHHSMLMTVRTLAVLVMLAAALAACGGGGSDGEKGGAQAGAAGDAADRVGAAGSASDDGDNTGGRRTGIRSNTGGSQAAGSSSGGSGGNPSGGSSGNPSGGSGETGGSGGGTVGSGVTVCPDEVVVPHDDPIVDGPDQVFTSARDGAWSDEATWDGEGVPGNGSTVVISHEVTLEQDTTVGTSPGSGSTPAITIEDGGKLVVQAGALLRCRGDLRVSSGELSLNAGSILEMDSTQNTSATYLITLAPEQGAVDALITAQGTDPCENRAEIRSNPIGHARITTGGSSNGGRIVANFCRFTGLGSSSESAWAYASDTSEGKTVVVDSIFDRCGSVVSEGIYADGHVEFVGCLWINSAAQDYNFVTGVDFDADNAVVARIVGCGFDRAVNFAKFTQYAVEDSVFKEGLFGYNGAWPDHGDYRYFQFKSFKGNVVIWKTQPHQWEVPYGNTLDGNLFIKDVETNNPHYMKIEGSTGTTVLKNNIFWLTAAESNPEGDVDIFSPSAGTPEQNRVIIERNLYLPNGNGPDGEGNLSVSGFTCHMTSGNNGNRQIEFRRNTMFLGMFGTSMGETEATYENTVTYFKSNLFYGALYEGNPRGGKIIGYNGAEEDALRPGNADYNASYRVINGTAYDSGLTSAKGYSVPISSGSGIPEIGAHDIDDLEPDFVDKYRTPATWNPDNEAEQSLSLASTLSKLAPEGTHSIGSLMDYLRAGFRPQASRLRGAGDPDEGSPDIGAVDME